MKNDENMKIFIFLEKVSQSLGEAQKDLRRPPEGLLIICRTWNATDENMKKFTEECFAQHVDGAPSTARSDVLN